MKLIIAEKNDAARQIAERLSTGKPKKDKVYNTAIYRFEWKGEECVTIGLAGHILAPDFCDSVLFDKKLGWYSVTEDGEMLPADMPDGLARPPYDTKRKPFLADGISIKGWKLESLPYLTWAPVIKLPAEKELIRSLKNLAKKSDSVIIATDFDREGELIGSDALNKVREVAPDLPVARAQYSSFTKAEITQAFDNLVSLDQNLADAGESRQPIDPQSSLVFCFDRRVNSVVGERVGLDPRERGTRRPVVTACYIDPTTAPHQLFASASSRAAAPSGSFTHGVRRYSRTFGRLVRPSILMSVSTSSFLSAFSASMIPITRM